MNWIRTFVAISLVTALLFELMSFMATKMDLFLVNDTPDLYGTYTFKKVPDIVYGRTEQEVWGAWHAQSSTYRLSTACSEVLMEFNEVGARDSSFTNLSDGSIILLGDSFAEGFGVSQNNTSQYLIENELDIPLLNFGSAGSFGPLQEFLIYKHHQKFPHQGLIVYVLPANDFTDNDSLFWNDISQLRYRPYFNQKGNPLTPYYFPAAVKRNNFKSPNLGDLKQFILENFWSANALRTFLMLWRGDTSIGKAYVEDISFESYFYDANQVQQSNLIIAYEAILDLAANRDVLFVVIPDQNDIAKVKNDVDPDRYKRQAWYEGFMSFEDRPQHRVSILNLMDHLPESTDELFISCDGHWSPRGNKWASNVIIRHIQDNGLFSSSTKN